MKTIKFLTITLVFIFSSLVSFSQTDTLYLNNGEKIYGVKITKISTMNVWYTQNKIGKSLPTKDVLKHTFKNEEQAQSKIVNKITEDNSNVTNFTLKTFSIFNLFSVRKNEIKFRKMIESKGYRIKETYSLPSVGALIIYVSKTIYVVEKK